MKNLALALSAVFGVSGLLATNEAEAGHKHSSGKHLARQILGQVIQHAVQNSHRSHGHHGHSSHGSHHGHSGHVSSRILRTPTPPRPVRHYHVEYHMHGSKTIHTHSHSLSHRWEDYLESLGLHVKVKHNGGHYDVVYHMHGKRSVTFTSHSAAHHFERQLERLGVHAKVKHH
jgi:hypothetical protein